MDSSFDGLKALVSASAKVKNLEEKMGGLEKHLDATEDRDVLARLQEELKKLQLAHIEAVLHHNTLFRAWYADRSAPKAKKTFPQKDGCLKEG